MALRQLGGLVTGLLASGGKALGWGALIGGGVIGVDKLTNQGNGQGGSVTSAAREVAEVGIVETSVIGGLDASIDAQLAGMAGWSGAVGGGLASFFDLLTKFFEKMGWEDAAGFTRGASDWSRDFKTEQDDKMRAIRDEARANSYSGGLMGDIGTPTALMAGGAAALFGSTAITKLKDLSGGNNGGSPRGNNGGSGPSATRHNSPFTTAETPRNMTPDQIRRAQTGAANLDLDAGHGGGGGKFGRLAKLFVGTAAVGGGVFALDAMTGQANAQEIDTNNVSFQADANAGYASANLAGTSLEHLTQSEIGLDDNFAEAASDGNVLDEAFHKGHVLAHGMQSGLVDIAAAPEDLYNMIDGWAGGWLPGNHEENFSRDALSNAANSHLISEPEIRDEWDAAVHATGGLATWFIPVGAAAKAVGAGARTVNGIRAFETAENVVGTADISRAITLGMH